MRSGLHGCKSTALVSAVHFPASSVVAEHLRHSDAVHRQTLVLNLRRPRLGHLLYHVGVAVALLVQGGNLRRQLALLRPLVGLVEGLVVCLPNLLRQQPVVLVAHLAETVQRALRHHDAFAKCLNGAEIKGHWEHAQCLVRKFDCIHNSIFFGLKNLFLPCFKFERPRKHSFQPFLFSFGPCDTLFTAF